MVYLVCWLRSGVVWLSNLVSNQNTDRKSVRIFRSREDQQLLLAIVGSWFYLLLIINCSLISCFNSVTGAFWLNLIWTVLFPVLYPFSSKISRISTVKESIPKLTCFLAKEKPARMPLYLYIGTFQLMPPSALGSVASIQFLSLIITSCASFGELSINSSIVLGFKSFTYINFMIAIYNFN
ncbi:hypothetical protein [Winogradskyella vidalii]|nr:hypothetical protein [Winogradskyella vidalii]